MAFTSPPATWHHPQQPDPFDTGLTWNNRFHTLGEPFYTSLSPTPLPAPYWVGRNHLLAAELGLSPDVFDSPELLQALSGNQPLLGSAPLASVYSGHQFGVWAGQLGDGRAILLGEVQTPDMATGQELQLKGAGKTPFSRMGDGRAVLRSSIREYVCSEAMHGLGIPTTRALCVSGSDAPVRRETLETAAVVTRVAPSFIRFGHFEHFCHHQQHADLRILADFVIEHYYPQCQSASAFGGDRYINLLQAVTERTAQMVAAWQSVGFCHGVMNTDNMSILGLTIDYGPFQFLDTYDAGHICNHSDHEGRYAFYKQPQVAYWNLFCLGQALLPLISDQKQAIAALETYKTTFQHSLAQRMAAKLGFAHASEQTAALADALLPLLGADRVDYSIFWRRLSHWVQVGDGNHSVRDLFLHPEGIDRWLLQYSELLAHADQAQAADLMLKTNPKFVLRNHLTELAIRAAKSRDFSLVQQLLQVLQRPFDEHPEFASFADFPPDWAGDISISCSS